jgi:hypothetical protein
MADRRYNEEEVAAIFRAAAEGSHSPALRAPRDEGLSLPDLQDIGREVGIAPEAVAHAAHALEVRGQGTLRRLLGLPVGVSRTILLGRHMTDAEWDLLVVELREVFGATGMVKAQGSLREWRNGNLRALLEPTPTGHRLRLTTVKGDARTSIVGGLMAIGMSAVVAVAGAAGGHLGGAVPGIALLAMTGVALVGNGVLRLPRWARLRDQQMEGIAARLAETAPALPPPPAPQD